MAGIIRSKRQLSGRVSLAYHSPEDREAARQKRIYLEIVDYINGRMTARDAYNEIALGKSGLSARCKLYLKTYMNVDNNT